MTRARDQQRQHWDSVAEGWSSWTMWTRTNFQPITDWLQRVLPWRAGGSTLDAACGAGYPLLEVGAWLRPPARIVAADVSPRMLCAAAEQARNAGLDRIDFVLADAGHLPCADRSFAIVTNTYGLMFCDDPARAVCEAHRVLSPGGALAIVTWDEFSRNPFFSVIHEVAASALSLGRPVPGAAGPFRLASAQAIDALLCSAGFGSVSIESRTMTVALGSAAEYLRLFSDVAWQRRMAALPAGGYTALEHDLAAAVAPYLVDGAVHLTAASICASAKKSG